MRAYRPTFFGHLKEFFAIPDSWGHSEASIYLAVSVEPKQWVVGAAHGRSVETSGLIDPFGVRDMEPA